MVSRAAARRSFRGSIGVSVLHPEQARRTRPGTTVRRDCRGIITPKSDMRGADGFEIGAGRRVRTRRLGTRLLRSRVIARVPSPRISLAKTFAI